VRVVGIPEKSWLAEQETHLFDGIQRRSQTLIRENREIGRNDREVAASRPALNDELVS